MKENGAIARFTKFLRKENNLQIAIVAVAAVALVAFILSGTFGGQPGQNNAGDGGGSALQASASEEELGQRLEEILTQVEGAGRVQVLVTYEAGPEIVPAVKTDTQSNSSDGGGSQSSSNSTQKGSEPVVVQGKNGTEPMVLMTKEPVIQGVLVVAEGASELDVRLRLAQAVQVALQIAPSRIEVLPMNISKNREGN
jgi:stage III sporulation protein AG